MTEIRCKKCNKLLMFANSFDGEIKCPKCGYKNRCSFEFYSGDVVIAISGKNRRSEPRQAMKFLEAVTKGIIRAPELEGDEESPSYGPFKGAGVRA